MSREDDDGTEELGICIGLSRIRVDAKALVNVNGVDISKIHPGDSGISTRSSISTLPAWLAASKVGSV